MAETGSPFTTGIVTTTPTGPSYDAGTYAIDEAQRIYGMGGPSYYEGQTYAGYSPEQIAAMEAQYNRAVGGSSLLSGAQDFTQKALAGDFQSAALPYATNLAGGVDYSEVMDMQRRTAQGDFLGGSPGLDAAIQRAVDPVQSRIASQLASRGRAGSGLAALEMARGLGDVAANVSYQDYDRERQNQLAAQRNLANLMGTQYESQLAGARFLGDVGSVGYNRMADAAAAAPALALADYNDINKMSEVGGLRQEMTQKGIDEQIDRFNFLQNQPYEELRKYLDAINLAPSGETSITQDTYYEPTDSEQATSFIALLEELGVI